MRALLRSIGAHRRRLAPLVLVAAVVMLALQASNAAPRETKVRVRLSDPHTVREVTLDYVDADGDDAAHARYSYPEGAPERLNDTHSLSPGRYELHVDVEREEGLRTIHDRALTVPADGTIVVDFVGEE